MFGIVHVRETTTVPDSAWSVNTQKTKQSTLGHEVLLDLMATFPTCCRNGVFQESLACLTRIQDSCHDDKKKQQLLKSYMDVSKWRNSWGVLCSSVQREFTFISVSDSVQWELFTLISVSHSVQWELFTFISVSDSV